MKLTFGEAKRILTLAHRGLDFARANELFEGPEFTLTDDRRDYGEIRYNTFGFLYDRMVSLT